jgi:prepilin-type processing-associated H-X9-DG protein
MEENLVGYLLDALDPDTRREVEKYVQEHPEAQRRLEVLRRALAPLEAAREEIVPPPNLSRRTIERVRAATTMVSRVPGRPAARTLVGAPAVPPRWAWRRVDYLVAASVLLCATLLLPPGVLLARQRYQIAACQGNLREFHAAFVRYSDHHAGEYPCAASAGNPSREVAGIVVPLLVTGGYLGEGANIACPAKRAVTASPYSLRDLEAMTDDDFDRCVDQLGGCYAYPLGYRDERGHHPPHRDLYGNRRSALPLMADRPPEDPATNLGNSPNHGSGQNVLYADGHARFVPHRRAGLDDDDIYTNAHGLVGAGTHKHDTVLGASHARP